MPGRSREEAPVGSWSQRPVCSRAEMDGLHRAAGQFVELSDNENKEAWEVISDRGDRLSVTAKTTTLCQAPSRNVT